jgi:hypothetical protein
MKKLIRIALLSAAIVQSTHANNIAVQDKAVRAAASAFLTALRADSVQGLPTDEQLQRLSPHLSPSLKEAIKHAERIRDREILRAPDEKPSWGDGDLFSSMSEGATKSEIATVALPSSIDGYVRVRQTLSEKGQKDATWHDTYLFRESGDTWLLEDMVMEGEWAKGGSLRGNLPGGLTEEMTHLSPNERWSMKFGMEGDAVANITLQASEKTSAPLVIEDRKGDHCLSFKTFSIWSPESTAVAIRLGESVDTSSTKVFVLKGDKWVRVELPEFFKAERETCKSNGFREEIRFVDPLYWEDDKTLVLLGVCTWSKGPEGDGISHRITVKIGDDGKSKVIRSVDTP